MFYQPLAGITSIGSNQSVRLLWMVEALQDVCDTDCDDDANWITQSNVIQTYYEEFTVSSLTVREDHGSELAIVAEPSSAGDVNYDDQLWHMANTLQKALMRVQLKGDGTRFSVNDIQTYKSTWDVGGLSVTTQSLNDQLDTLRIGSLTDVNAELTTGVGSPAPHAGAQIHHAGVAEPNVDGSHSPETTHPERHTAVLDTPIAELPGMVPPPAPHRPVPAHAAAVPPGRHQQLPATVLWTGLLILAFRERAEPIPTLRPGTTREVVPTVRRARQ
jgi:hypothetical protein